MNRDAAPAIARDMEPMMRGALVASLPLFAFGAQAGDLQPRQEEWVGIDDDTAALVSYVPAPEGFRVQALVEQRGDFGAFALQVSTVLSPGQWTEISVPHWTGETMSALRIQRDGDTLRVEPRPNPAR
ncbi:MAG: hypothetical protein H7Z10_10165 [Gemmatimonadaceae bacterium]|nr:hypothetical protein [Acetobacteraceae bacterium]